LSFDHIDFDLPKGKRCPCNKATTRETLSRVALQYDYNAQGEKNQETVEGVSSTLQQAWLYRPEDAILLWVELNFFDKKRQIRLMVTNFSIHIKKPMRQNNIRDAKRKEKIGRIE
jgi:hypothetical protein